MTPEQKAFIEAARTILGSRDSFVSKQGVYCTVNVRKESEWSIHCFGVKDGFQFIRTGIPYSTPLIALAEDLAGLRAGTV